MGMSLDVGWDSGHRGALKPGEQSPFSGVNPPDSGAATPQQEGQGRGAPTMQTACLCSYSNCFRLLASGHPALDLPATPPEASTEAGAGPWGRVTCVSPAYHPCVTPRAALPPARWTPQSHAGPAGPCFTPVFHPCFTFPHPPSGEGPKSATSRVPIPSIPKHPTTSPRAGGTGGSGAGGTFQTQQSRSDFVSLLSGISFVQLQGQIHKKAGSAVRGWEFWRVALSAVR